jgi:hypothetical protein
MELRSFISKTLASSATAVTNEPWKMSAFNVLVKFVWQRPRTLAIAGVALVAAGAAVAVGRPHLVSEPLLGKEWQCSRTVFFVTTCEPVGEQNSRPPAAVRYARSAKTGGRLWP